MSIVTDSQKIKEILTRGVSAVYPNVEHLTKELQSGRQLTFYLGIDPTGPTLHLGHAIQIKRLGEFQQLGHKVILLIGDFTAQIGDPSGKDKTREPLTHEQVLKNARLYREQAKIFLDFDDKKNPAELKYNSHWLSKLTFDEVIKLAGFFTVQQMLERDMFERRVKEGKPIGLHEFLYPLMQGYDSVAMNVDVELCGNDQIFNTLVGRDLVLSKLKKEKYVVAGKLLTDNTGKKMGKSEGNMISFLDSANEKYGKVMAMDDGLMLSAFELCTYVPTDEIKKIEAELKKHDVNPRDIKMRLAKEIVKVYHGIGEAELAEENFVKIFQKKDKPLAIEAVELNKKKIMADGKITVTELFMSSGLVSSKNEIRRLIAQNGLKINDLAVKDIDFDYKDGEEFLLQKGKRFFKRVILK